MDVERLSYRPESKLAIEGINKVGVVVMVANPRGEIWTVREVSKKEHEGEISVLCETRKVGETIWSNTQAALIEEMGVTEEDKYNYYYFDGKSYLGRVSFPDGKKKIHADVILLLYTGDRLDFPSRNEVTPYGWLKPEDLVSHPRLRPGAVPALSLALEKQAIPNLLHTGNGKRAILGKVDVLDFFRARSMKSDIGF